MHILRAKTPEMSQLKSANVQTRTYANRHDHLRANRSKSGGLAGTEAEENRRGKRERTDQMGKGNRTS